MEKLLKDIKYQYVKMLNGSSSDMNVDGSETPVVFKYTSSDLVYLERVQLFLLDSGTMTSSSFGSISALSNGLSYGYTKNSTQYTIDTIKTNLCVMMNFSDNMNNGTTSTGFLNEEDYFFGSVIFPEPILLRSDDTIEFTVNDDLTGIDALKARARIWSPI